ncbi:MAG: coenzyme F430 synthase [Methanobacterium sp.]
MLRKSFKDVLVVDMTHGGKIIAIEFSKLPSCNVFGWDIYNTLTDGDKDNLQENGVKLVDENYLKRLYNPNPQPNVSSRSNLNELDILSVVAPIHCNLDYPVDMSHHEAVAFLLMNRIEIPVIEVTGVKGKTSVVHMLKEIFKDLNPLILSSLGVEVVDDGEIKLLKRDISITPASIIDAWRMSQDYDVGIFIIETSLGGTGLADVGILTNIIEDYTIAKGTRKASQAKIQIFNNKLVACDYDSFNLFYPDFKDKTNTFSIDGKGNVKASNIIFGFHETVFQVEVKDLKTISSEIYNDSFEISTFAPALHHVQNVLSTICASLTLGISKNTIITGLKNFNGLKGRTSITNRNDIRIIEEVNPGINLATIKKSISMLEDLPRSSVVFGGKYGVTCEEINEESAASILNELTENIQLILTDELGNSVKDTMKRDFHYIPYLDEAMDYAFNSGCQNILLIYRSNFHDLQHR